MDADLVERCASAAFEWDRKNGHIHGGPRTWHMLPEHGRESYRQMVTAVLAEAGHELVVNAAAATVKAWFDWHAAGAKSDSDESVHLAETVQALARGGR